MKKTAYTMIALLILAGTMAAAAEAQSVRQAQVRVSIPFQFHVANTTMPAGEYLVQQLNSNSEAATLQVSRKDGSVSAIINMIGATGNGQSVTRLGFRRYGNQFYFGELWLDGESEGLRAPQSKAERATQKELAALNVTMETVALRVR